MKMPQGPAPASLPVIASSQFPSDSARVPELLDSSLRGSLGDRGNQTTHVFGVPTVSGSPRQALKIAACLDSVEAPALH